MSESTDLWSPDIPINTHSPHPKPVKPNWKSHQVDPVLIRRRQLHQCLSYTPPPPPPHITLESNMKSRLPTTASRAKNTVGVWKMLALLAEFYPVFPWTETQASLWQERQAWQMWGKHLAQLVYLEASVFQIFSLATVFYYHELKKMHSACLFVTWFVKRINVKQSLDLLGGTSAREEWCPSQ